jgi:hypothetical protein
VSAYCSYLVRRVSCERLPPETLARHPDVIQAHAGGVLPVLAPRILALAPMEWVPDPCRDQQRPFQEAKFLLPGGEGGGQP